MSRTSLASKPADGGQASYLGRLLSLLGTIGENDGLSLSELSRETDLSSSTAHRLVALLVEHDFVRRDPVSKRFSSGPRLERLGLRSLGRILEPGRFDPVVERLAEITGESVSLGLLLRDELVLVARRESMHSLRAVVHVGDSVPMHTSAMGKSILARLDPVRRRELLAPLGEHLDQTLASLSRELDEVRRDGFARDEQTFAVGLHCVAAAFCDARGRPIGGISLAGPAARFSVERAISSVPQLLSEVASISHELGFDG